MNNSEKLSLDTVDNLRELKDILNSSPFITILVNGENVWDEDRDWFKGFYGIPSPWFDVFLENFEKQFGNIENYSVLEIKFFFTDYHHTIINIFIEENKDD